MKKSLGQHFLTNPKIHEAIVEAAEIKPGDFVVEVGPGSGLLTDHLLAAGTKILAIEKDRDFVVQLREKYRDNPQIEITYADILTFDPSFAIRHSNFVIVGNIPYYLTSHLLRKILQEWPTPRTIVFMIQKEVARRMTAKPPNMNMLAVLVQYYSVPSIIKIVKAGNFRPIPKVNSAIVKLTPSRPPPWGEVPQAEGVLDVASRGFKNPRKKLSNNLPKELIEQAGIDPNRRAETLTVDEWKTLAGMV